MATVLRFITLVMVLAFSGCGWECNASTCPNGCCEPGTNVCVLNGGQSRCGAAGRMCLACPSGATCSSQGQCTACSNFLERCTPTQGCCSSSDLCSFRSASGFTVCQ
jgi:hypothetical protein